MGYGGSVIAMYGAWKLEKGMVWRDLVVWSFFSLRAARVLRLGAYIYSAIWYHTMLSYVRCYNASRPSHYIKCGTREYVKFTRFMQAPSEYQASYQAFRVRIIDSTQTRV